MSDRDLPVPKKKLMTKEQRALKGRGYLRSVVEPAVKKIEEKVPQPGLELIIPSKVHREPMAGEYVAQKGTVIMRRAERGVGMAAAESYLKKKGPGLLKRLVLRRFGVR